MNRRAVVVLGVAGALSSVGARAQARPPRCVVMEEREGALILEGSGQRLSEPFTMAAGKFRIEVELLDPADMDVGVSIDFIRRSDGEEVSGFSATNADQVPEFSSGLVDFPEAGEYLADVSLYRSNWKIALSPL